ncbi:MAG: 4Fe-4S dicluster domain-containing protein [Candidatus Altiarchaeota archaeon]
MAEIKIILEKCTGCGVCASICPVGVYEIKDGKSVPVNAGECVVCRACENMCPEEAISVEEVLE